MLKVINVQTQTEMVVVAKVGVDSATDSSSASSHPVGSGRGGMPSRRSNHADDNNDGMPAQEIDCACVIISTFAFSHTVVVLNYKVGNLWGDGCVQQPVKDLVDWWLFAGITPGKDNTNGCITICNCCITICKAIALEPLLFLMSVLIGPLCTVRAASTLVLSVPLILLL